MRDYSRLYEAFGLSAGDLDNIFTIANSLYGGLMAGVVGSYLFFYRKMDWSPGS